MQYLWGAKDVSTSSREKSKEPRLSCSSQLVFLSFLQGKARISVLPWAWPHQEQHRLTLKLLGVHYTC